MASASARFLGWPHDSGKASLGVGFGTDTLLTTHRTSQVKFWIRFFILLCLVANTEIAFAAPTSQYVLNNRNSVQMMSYVMGVFSGLQWANGELSGKKRELLFCEPSRNSIGYEQIMDILSSFINVKYPSLASQPVGLGLLRALQEAYPCSQ